MKKKIHSNTEYQSADGGTDQPFGEKKLISDHDIVNSKVFYSSIEYPSADDGGTDQPLGEKKPDNTEYPSADDGGTDQPFGEKKPDNIHLGQKLSQRRSATIARAWDYGLKNAKSDHKMADGTVSVSLTTEGGDDLFPDEYESPPTDTSRGGIWRDVPPLDGGVAANCRKVMRKPKRPEPKYDEMMDVERTYTPSDEMVYGTREATNPSDVEDFADIKDAIHILRSPERTLVFAIVVDKEHRDTNVMSAIRCRGGTPFGGYAYDRGRDAYIVQCADFIEIGNIPFSFVQTMDKVGTWQARIPIPEGVLEKHFTPQQRRLLADYGKKYQSPRFEIQYIQMLGCH